VKLCRQGQAQIETETERGGRLLERYGSDEQPRPRYAFVGQAGAKRKRRR